MEIPLMEWNCEKCDRSNRTFRTRNGSGTCDSCGASTPAARAVGGEILRHWTTDSSSFAGATVRPRSEYPGREVNDPCRVNLVASKLRFLKAQSSK